MSRQQLQNWQGIVCFNTKIDEALFLSIKDFVFSAHYPIILLLQSSIVCRLLQIFSIICRLLQIFSFPSSLWCHCSVVEDFSRPTTWQLKGLRSNPVGVTVHWTLQLYYIAFCTSALSQTPFYILQWNTHSLPVQGFLKLFIDVHLGPMCRNTQICIHQYKYTNTNTPI